MIGLILMMIHGIQTNKPQRKYLLYYNIMWYIFSPGTPVSSTNKTDRHDITEILLKVALNTIIRTLYTITTTHHKNINNIFIWFVLFFFQISVILCIYIVTISCQTSHTRRFARSLHTLKDESMAIFDDSLCV
jgi:hypothetical protein